MVDLDRYLEERQARDPAFKAIWEANQDKYDAISFHRGHLIYYSQAQRKWFYVDDDVPISTERPCPLCHKPPTPEGYDACLGYISGAKTACCGHGVHDGYVLTDEGKISTPCIRED